MRWGEKHMSVIDSIELYYANVPIPAPFSPSWVVGGHRNSYGQYLIRITTDDGVSGFSSYSGARQERAGTGEALAALLLGADVADMDYILDALHNLVVRGTYNYWIEPAIWDIRGKLAGKPVCELFGVKARKIDLYVSAGETKEPGARIDEALAHYEAGFRVMKMRVHDADERVDIRQVQEPARALQGKMSFGVDCNQAVQYLGGGKVTKWDLPRAKRFVDACQDVGLLWVEEPLFMDRYDDLAALCEYSKMPIGGGEVQPGRLPELTYMIEKRCYDIFQSDAMWTGGILSALEVARRARAAGLQYTPHSWGNGIGLAVNLHVFAASGFADELTFEYPLNPPGWTVEARDALLTEPFRHDRGTLQVPDKPGLGFDIDERALARYGVCFFKANRKSAVWMPEALRDIKAPAALAR